MANTEQLAHWFSRLEGGDAEALDRVIPLLYDDLRDMARYHLKAERFRETMGTTALVNEAYIRLSEQEQLRPESRAHFFGIASRTMRRVLVDYARARRRVKRGGGELPVPFDEAQMALSVEEADEILALDEALEALATMNERAATVVQYRFFGGLSVEETGEVMGISVRTVSREWSVARAWLLTEVKRHLELPDSRAE
jgi:RNA polymerase sigma factor (TIGR02999 family)